MTNTGKWGMLPAATVGVLLHLAAKPGEFETQQECLADIGTFVGVSASTVSEAICFLVAHQCVAKDKTGGSGANVYRVRDPKVWSVELPWRYPKREAIVAVGDLCGLDYRAQDVASYAVLHREQALVARGTRVKKNPVEKGLARGTTPRTTKGLARGTTPRTNRPSLSNSCLQRVCREELEGGREPNIDLSEAERDLLRAMFHSHRTTGYFEGSALERIRDVAKAAGELLPTLVELASDAEGPSLFKRRIKQLETALREGARFAQCKDPAVEWRVRKRALDFELEGVVRDLEGMPGNKALEDEKLKLEAELDEVLKLLQGAEHPEGILEA
jgi:hypothetical protein